MLSSTFLIGAWHISRNRTFFVPTSYLLNGEDVIGYRRGGDLMKQRHWKCRRQGVEHLRALSRWDQAYQCLLRWTHTPQQEPARRKSMNIAAYVRVSGHRQVQTQTIEQQLERLQTHCQRENWFWGDVQICAR